MFTDLVDMLDHKRDYCKLRFTCKCDLLNEEECDCDASTPELFNNNSTSSSGINSSNNHQGASPSAEDASKSDTPGKY